MRRAGKSRSSETTRMTAKTRSAIRRITRRAAEHREVRATFSFQCQAAIRSGSRVQFAVTKLFPDIHELKVQVLSDANQTGATIKRRPRGRQGSDLRRPHRRDQRHLIPDRPPKTVLRVAELIIVKGEKIFLHGPSGCGKTTLLGVLAGVLKASQGSVKVLGQDLSQMSGRRARRFARRAYRLHLSDVQPDSLSQRAGKHRPTVPHQRGTPTTLERQVPTLMKQGNWRSAWVSGRLLTTTWSI